MQRLSCWRAAGAAPRLVRVLAVRCSNTNNNNNQWMVQQQNAFKRYLSSASDKDKSQTNTGEVDSHPNLYKPSTSAQKTKISKDLHRGQPVETYGDKKLSSTDTPPPTVGGGKVWSVQDPGSVHVAPTRAVASTAFVPKATDNAVVHETTVYSTQGNVNIVDPFKTHTLVPDITPGQAAEAAAASAFEPFAPDAPLTSSPAGNAPTFAPKISSTDVYSSTSSPTAEFETAMPPSADTHGYRTAKTSTVFGGQDTSTGKQHSMSDPGATKKANKASSDGTNEIPIQRETDLRDEILRESLKFVDDKGWTMEAIRAGVRVCNHPTTVEGLFSNGYDLVEFFVRDANAKMSTHMNELASKGDVQGSRLLTEGLKYRIGLVIPYARTWDQALAQGALPQNAMRGWKNLLDLSSEAWHGIGDVSTDVNWYTKRLLLAAVYKTSEIFMLQDQSPDKIETIKFLERRLSDFNTMASVKNSASKSLSDTAHIAGGLFSMVRNLTFRR